MKPRLRAGGALLSPKIIVSVKVVILHPVEAEALGDGERPAALLGVIGPHLPVAAGALCPDIAVVAQDASEWPDVPRSASPRQQHLAAEMIVFHGLPSLVYFYRLSVFT